MQPSKGRLGQLQSLTMPNVIRVSEDQAKQASALTKSSPCRILATNPFGHAYMVSHACPFACIVEHRNHQGKACGDTHHGTFIRSSSSSIFHHIQGSVEEPVLGGDELWGGFLCVLAYHRAT